MRGYPHNPHWTSWWIDTLEIPWLTNMYLARETGHCSYLIYLSGRISLYLGDLVCISRGVPRKSNRVGRYGLLLKLTRRIKKGFSYPKVLDLGGLGGLVEPPR